MTTYRDDDMDDKCWSCYQTVPQGRVHSGCFECGHAWRTRWHLMWDNHKVCRQLDYPLLRSFRKPGHIYVCPCCAHDL